MSAPIVEARNLKFAYNTDGPEVLRGINLALGKGEYVALVGQNGVGKSTLAKHFNGLLKPTDGEVLVEGRDTRQLPIEAAAKVVGYCYQNPDHQIFLDTIEKEVAFGPRNLGMPENIVQEYVEEALRAVGLWEVREEEPYFAGKGERQKVAVASVLAMHPQVIILDEPTTGLDWRGSQEMMTLVKRLWQDGHTVVIITHNMRLVAEYAQRVVVLSDGQVLLDDAPAVVLQQREMLAQTFLRPPQITELWLALGPPTNPWLSVRQALSTLAPHQLLA